MEEYLRFYLVPYVCVRHDLVAYLHLVHGLRLVRLLVVPKGVWWLSCSR